MTSESRLEKLARHECKKRGLVLIKLYPFNMIGIPDRLILAHPGRVMFLEIKTNDGKLSPRQRIWHKRLKALGFSPVVTYGKSDLLKALDTFERVPG